MRSWSAPRRRSPWAWRPPRSRECPSSAEDPRPRSAGRGAPAATPSALQQRRHHLDDPSTDLGHGNLLGCRPTLLAREPERLRVGRPARRRSGSRSSRVGRQPSRFPWPRSVDGSSRWCRRCWSADGVAAGLPAGAPRPRVLSRARAFPGTWWPPCPRRPASGCTPGTHPSGRPSRRRRRRRPERRTRPRDLPRLPRPRPRARSVRLPRRSAYDLPDALTAEGVEPTELWAAVAGVEADLAVGYAALVAVASADARDDLMDAFLECAQTQVAMGMAATTFPGMPELG